MSLQMQTKTRETHHSAFLLACLMTTLLWTTPSGTALAQQEAIAAVGQQEFRHACAVCHGLGGKGESVMTALNLLTVRPPDLTQLRKKHQGQFPFWQVYRIIDGREEVKGHGTRDMPIWGEVFRHPEGGKRADETSVIGRILALVYYLQSIQE